MFIGNSTGLIQSELIRSDKWEIWMTLGAITSLNKMGDETVDNPSTSTRSFAESFWVSLVAPGLTPVPNREQDMSIPRTWLRF